MNPPTAGHEKLLDFLKAKAGNNPFRIYLTQTEDNNKNPIPFVQKVKFARKGFPQYARQIMLDKKLKTIFNAMTSFYDEGFKRVVIVAGDDRVREYEITLKKYNGKEGKHGFYNFERITVLSAGKRDPESKGVEGVSGTKLREYVKSGDFTKFAQYMPKRLSNADTKSVYNAVRKGLGLNEQKEFRNHIQLDSVSETREAYISGSLCNVGDKVIIKETDEVAEVKVLGTNYVIVELNGMQSRKWLDSIEVIEDYYKGLSKSTADKRKAHFNRNAKKADDNKSAYKPAPGDAKAKTKLSKHTLKFRQMYGEDIAMAKQRISNQKKIEKRRDAADAKRHDRMMDTARLAAARRKNRNTQP
tara:strand:+ start:347 stop:1420 length:1074 start_codon:yes stop_codon:yes gene_type:complete